MNKAAERLLGVSFRQLMSLQHISIEIANELKQWRDEVTYKFIPLHKTVSTTGFLVDVTFTLDIENDRVLIFLEDASRVIQEAQQMKLASLGRFTASIAHELRNPLGAVAHAAQL